MKWLTISEIKRRSETAEGALKVSYEHWCQLYRATQKELREAYNSEKIYIDQNGCGLCERYFVNLDCRGCPLRSCDGEGTLYRKARNSFIDWIDGNGTWKAWKQTSKAVRDRLKKLINV